MLIENKITLIDLIGQEKVLFINGDIEPINDLKEDILKLLKITDSPDNFLIYKISENKFQLYKKDCLKDNFNCETYDISISFADEDREIAENIAKRIKRNGYKVFYDRYEQSHLWGKDLYTYLSHIYKEKSSYCIIIISEHYKRKIWTRHELKAAQARAFEENREYILPIKIDNTEIDGILPTTGFINIRDHSYEEIVIMISEKLSSISAKTYRT